MAIGSCARWACVCLLVAAGPAPAAAQIFETVGTRAQGMGGAFVAVANDSSATWWNPAGLADGPFLDMAWGRSQTDVTPDQRNRGSWFALATPPFGFSYYRLQVSDIAPAGPTVSAAARRQEGGAGLPVRTLEASQIGATVLQTLLDGVHVGATVKYVRGSVDDGETDHGVDLDVGALAVAGPVRLGITGRNLAEPAFADESFVLPRQVRVGVAFDAAKLPGPGLTVAVDADVMRYEPGTGERRVIAVGAEQWLLARRLAIRGGGRFNTVGGREASATAGASAALRAGLYVDGFVVRGGDADDRGWGVAARVSF